jgi:hypothetical protein
MGLKKLLEETAPGEEPGQPDVVSEELHSVPDVFEARDYFLKIFPSPPRERRVKKMPDEVPDHDHSGGAMDETPEVKTPLGRENPLEKFEFIEKQRQAGDDEEEESSDEEPVLSPLDKVQAQENFVVPDEGRSIHVFES